MQDAQAPKLKTESVRGGENRPWRTKLAKWQAQNRHDLRERWGRAANALEESGLSWVEAEERAMRELEQSLETKST